jgi:hypothetical protein
MGLGSYKVTLMGWNELCCTNMYNLSLKDHFLLALPKYDRQCLSYFSHLSVY